MNIPYFYTNLEFKKVGRSTELDEEKPGKKTPKVRNNKATVKPGRGRGGGSAADAGWERWEFPGDFPAPTGVSFPRGGLSPCPSPVKFPGTRRREEGSGESGGAWGWFLPWWKSGREAAEWDWDFGFFSMWEKGNLGNMQTRN